MECFKILPKGSISSWRDLEHSFKEQYGDKPNTSYILNEFNKIKKFLDESILELNDRF